MTAQEEMIRIEECDAWYEYLEAVQDARKHSEKRYLDVEGWAWARLRQKLRAVERRKQGLVAA